MDSPCHYCGMLATCTDHVVPVVVVATLSALEDGDRRLKGRILTVPACHECNSLAAAHYFDTLAERVAYVKGRLRKRLRRDLECADFTLDELEEFSPALRGHVLEAMRRKEFARQRIAWEPGVAEPGHTLSMVHTEARRRFRKAS